MRYRIHAATLSFVIGMILSPPAAFSQTKDDPKLPGKVATAHSSDISDWALSGVVWSDANLARKLALAALKSSESESTRSQLNEVVVQSSQVIDALEQFGWREVKQVADSSANPNTADTQNRSVKLRQTEDSSSAGSASEKEGSVPSEEEAEKAIREFSGKRGSRRQSKRDTKDTQTSTAPIKRLDTETPAGSQDPGIDDERMPQKAVVDIDQYRVDDYVDETPAERRNLADAKEDAVEGAIAAAAGRRGIAGPASDRISDREGWTLSATLPYSTDSVYDQDDYDPNVDYRVENPGGVDSVNAASADRSDLDDDIDVDNPTEAVTGEDELTNAITQDRLSDEPPKRNDTSQREPSSEDRSQSPRMDRIPMGNFTTQEAPNPADASWVQFRLDANQWRYSMTNPAQTLEATRDALRQLQSSAMIAGRSTQNAELREILAPILSMGR